MKKALLLILLSNLTIAAAAQERSFSTLPLVNNPNPDVTAGDTPADSIKYEKALKIYNALVNARGDFRYPVPAFVMRKEEAKVAKIDYEDMEITLEEKAFDVCSSFGDKADAAVAFLLGHELTHYYEKHAWRSGFAADYSDLNIGIKLDSLTDDVTHETEADYLGGFLAYSAGYGMFDQGPAIIKKLYKSYGLPDTLPKYPVLSDRQAMAQRSAEKLQRLVEVFDMANLLTAIGRYGEAYQYYRYVLMQYQSREIYNNLGVTAVLDAYQYFKEGELKFRYPLELDLESSATKGDGMVSDREKLLRQALKHFDAAISLDPKYAPAYLNKACTYALLGDTLRARFYAEREARPAALESKSAKTAIDINILIAILDATAGDTASAKQLLTDAATKDSSALAAHNLKILNNEPLPKPKSEGFSDDIETIDELDLFLMAPSDMSFDESRSITMAKNLYFKQNPKQGPGSRLYMSQNRAKRQSIYFHITGPGYTGKTAKNLAIGAKRAEIVAAYETPKNTIETPQGEIMVYENMIFILGADHKLARWVNYKL